MTQQQSGSGQYFETTPAVPSRPGTVTLALPDLTVELVTDTGVFSHAAVDPGTKYLLLEAPAPPSAAVDLLDLGCGYGPIAVALAHRSPGATVWAVDTNRRALDCCRENATLLGLDNVRVVTPEEVPTSVRFDAVYSNPPIRIGKDALRRLLLTWLDRLRPDAHAYLVVHKHLGSDSLLGWLDEQGRPTSRLGSRQGYRLLDIRREAAA